MTRLPFMLIAMFVFSATLVAQAEPPKLLRDVWQLPHDIHWQLSDGQRWYSLGHTPHVVTIVPVKDAQRVTAVNIEIHRVSTFGKQAQPVQTQRVTAYRIEKNEPGANKPKRGLHFDGKQWDFHFGWTPKADHTTLQLVTYDYPPHFRCTLRIHGEGTLAKDGSFKDVQIHLLVAELLIDSDPTYTASFMEPQDELWNKWYDALPVKPRWAMAGGYKQDMAAENGRLEITSDGKLIFEPSKRFGEAALRYEQKQARKRRDAWKPKVSDHLNRDDETDQMQLDLEGEEN